MTMKVIYIGTDAAKRRKMRGQEPNLVMLLFDRWDDFNFKTTFATESQVDGKPIDLGNIKILVENELH